MAEPTAFGQQYGVIPWQLDANLGLQVLLITSRISRKWLIPKGWLVSGLSGAGSACREAFEEAGIEGAPGPDPVGTYNYVKVAAGGAEIPCQVTVFAMQVHRLCETWPEAEERTREWFSLPKAAAMVSEPGLRDLLDSVVPEQLAGSGPT